MVPQPPHLVLAFGNDASLEPVELVDRAHGDHVHPRLIHGLDHITQEQLATFMFRVIRARRIQIRGMNVRWVGAKEHHSVFDVG